MSHLKARNAAENNRAYTVLREVIRNSDNAYSSHIADELNTSQGDVSHILTTLKSVDIVEKSKKTRAQYYKFNPKKAMHYMRKEKYRNNFSINENFISFIENYVELYVRFNKRSTILDMLREDLVTMLSGHALDSKLPEYLESFLEDIGSDRHLYDKKNRKIIQTAIKKTER